MSDDKNNKSNAQIIEELKLVIEKKNEKLLACDSLIASFVKYLSVLIDY